MYMTWRIPRSIQVSEKAIERSTTPLHNLFTKTRIPILLGGCRVCMCRCIVWRHICLYILETVSMAIFSKYDWNINCLIWWCSKYWLWSSTALHMSWYIWPTLYNSWASVHSRIKLISYLKKLIVHFRDIVHDALLFLEIWRDFPLLRTIIHQCGALETKGGGHTLCQMV